MAWLALAALGVLACGSSAKSPVDMQSGNPLGASFWLIPTPSDDDSVIGRTFRKPPDTALSLEEQSQANPCGDKLAEARTGEMANHYEDAIDVKNQASGGAMLGLFGFSADVSTASHFLYKVSTTKKTTRLDTSEYVECCKSKECGWGYVSALIFGEGEYVSANQAEASASASYMVQTAKGSSSFSVLHKRQIKGFLAAVITAHDRAQAAQACPPDKEWAGTECVAKGEIESNRNACKGKQGGLLGLIPSDSQIDNVKKKLGAASCQWLDEHHLQH